MGLPSSCWRNFEKIIASLINLGTKLFHFTLLGGLGGLPKKALSWIHFGTISSLYCIRGVWGSCPPAVEENLKKKCFMDKFGHHIVSLCCIRGSGRPVKKVFSWIHLCTNGSLYCIRGVWGACPSSCWRKFEKKCSWINLGTLKNSIWPK